MKNGYPLRSIEGFDPGMLEILRNTLSISTAEEFLSFATSSRDEVARLLNAGDRGIGQLAASASAVLSPGWLDEILHPGSLPDLRTGLDAPAEDMLLSNPPPST